MRSAALLVVLTCAALTACGDAGGTSALQAENARLRAELERQRGGVDSTGRPGTAVATRRDGPTEPARHPGATVEGELVVLADLLSGVPANARPGAQGWTSLAWARLAKWVQSRDVAGKRIRFAAQGGQPIGWIIEEESPGFRVVAGAWSSQRSNYVEIAGVTFECVVRGQDTEWDPVSSRQWNAGTASRFGTPDSVLAAPLAFMLPCDEAEAVRLTEATMLLWSLEATLESISVTAPSEWGPASFQCHVAVKDIRVVGTPTTVAPELQGSDLFGEGVTPRGGDPFEGFENLRRARDAQRSGGSLLSEDFEREQR